MCTNAVVVWNNFDQKSLCIEVCHHCLTCFVAVHSCVFAAKGIDGSVIVQDVDLFEIVAFTYFEVVRVVCRCDLNATCSEFFVNVLICDNRDLTVRQRQFQHLADQILVSLILRVYCHCGITEQCFRTCGCDFYESSFFAYDRIVDVPEKSVLVLMLNFCIRDGSLAYRTPVDDPGAFVNVTFLVETDENFLYCLGASFVHGETFSLPVSRCTELLELVDDLSAVLFFPCPCMFEEFFTSDVVFVDSLFFQLVDDFDLCCDRCVVSSRLPECFISLHSLETDQDILHGLIKCMSHMKLAGYVRRRHNDGKWFFIWIYFCVEVSVVHPFLIETFFQPFRVISLCKFFAHNVLLLYRLIPLLKKQPLTLLV